MSELLTASSSTFLKVGTHMRRKHKHKDVHTCDKHKHKAAYAGAVHSHFDQHCMMGVQYGGRCGRCSQSGTGDCFQCISADNKYFYFPYAYALPLLCNFPPNIMNLTKFSLFTAKSTPFLILIIDVFSSRLF